MCKFIGKSNERILCKLSKSEILRLYSIVHVAMETKKTSHFTCQWKSFISIFFTCQVSACELQPFSCHDLANDIYSQTAKTVFSHLKLLCTTQIWRSQSLSVKTQNPWNNTYELGPTSYWHSSPGGARGGGYSTNSYTAEAHPLTFYIPFFTISYTFYWQMVLLSHTLLRTLYPF